jgi:hypothetical protein
VGDPVACGSVPGYVEFPFRPFQQVAQLVPMNHKLFRRDRERAAFLLGKPQPFERRGQRVNNPPLTDLGCLCLDAYPAFVKVDFLP